MDSILGHIQEEIHNRTSVAQSQSVVVEGLPDYY
jgi:hypothetical protein